MADETFITASNPIIYADYPDPDVIRVGDVYYMITTTMHMFPGGQILKSYDLAHWEHAGYVFDHLDHTPQQRLEDGNIYGKGMWAASLRFHKGVFHVVFCANDTQSMYHYTAAAIEGPWERHPMSGFYHDNSVLFDDDGRVFIVYGNTEIHLTELLPDLSQPKPGGIDKIIIRDEGDVLLGYEGSHLYKIDGRYYLFLIHWPHTGHGRRTQALFTADRIDGEWIGGDCLDEDLGFFNSGVAQGGIVDTPQGEYYAMLFQDHGAQGRMPVLVPVSFEDGQIRMEQAKAQVQVRQSHPEHTCRPLFGSDDFSSGKREDFWQWNHEPKPELCFFDAKEKCLKLKTDRITENLPEAVNILTQRCFGKLMTAEVTVCGEGLKEGDRAGICALQGQYAEFALTRKNGRLELLIAGRSVENGKMAMDLGALEKETVTLQLRFDYRDKADQVTFYVKKQEEYEPVGSTWQLRYTLDHFMGCRVGLFLYSTKEPGGEARFSDFRMKVD